MYTFMYLVVCSTLVDTVRNYSIYFAGPTHLLGNWSRKSHFVIHFLRQGNSNRFIRTICTYNTYSLISYFLTFYFLTSYFLTSYFLTSLHLTSLHLTHYF